MKKSMLIIVLLLAATAFSPASFAGCTKAQLSGTWLMFFSDGNYCRLKYKPNGVLDVSKSDCVDPDRGVTAPDSGSMEIESGGECAISSELVVEGVAIDLVLHFTTDRSSGAGAYYVPDFSTKGSLSLVRLH